MEELKNPSSQKPSRPNSSHSSTTSSVKRQTKCGQPQPFRLRTESRGQMKEQALVRKLQESAAEERKNRIPMAQGLPLTTEKPQILPKPPLKEKTKPSKIKLHTEQRAARRAGFDDMVAYKMYSQEFLKRYQERLIKMIEEEDIKALRKEMIPKAQLMPLFDEPFFPQRSNRPLTIPREPSFCILDYYRYPQRMYYKYETY